METKNVIIGFLLLIILISTMCWMIGGYNKHIDNKMIEGGNIAVVQIFNEAVQCKSIPLSYGNVSINLVAYECLQSEE